MYRRRMQRPARGFTPRCAASAFRSPCLRCLLFRRATNAHRHEVQQMLKYTKDHEWLRVDGDVATVGITLFAQEKLGDLVYVELPNVGVAFAAGGGPATRAGGEGAPGGSAPPRGGNGPGQFKGRRPPRPGKG